MSDILNISENIALIFTQFRNHINENYESTNAIQNACNDLGKILREANTLLQVIHYDGSAAVMPACVKTRELFNSAREAVARLKNAVPSNDYYKYQDLWRTMLQRYCFLIALTEWLETGTLASTVTVGLVLDINPVEKPSGFHLDVEDYLHGLLQLCSELARFTVNSATRGDYERPLQISKFVMELNAGFRLLTLKNDQLRKRFDVLKYDMKKIEEVVYDIISVRGIRPNTKSVSEVESVPAVESVPMVECDP